MEKNLYNVINVYEVGGNSSKGERAYTPFDAAEKATRRMGWREKERIVEQRVMILDGTKQEWIFKK